MTHDRLGMKFHHFGLAVRDDQAALTFLDAQGFALGERIFDPNQNVYVRLCTAAHHPTVEIVQPGVGKSPVDTFISRYNELIYHSCYEVPDLNDAVNAISALGLRMVALTPPKPAPLFGGRMVSFHKIAGYGIVELLQSG